MMAASAPAPGFRARYQKALEQLRSAQKSSKGAPAYSRFINRPLGRRFAAVAAQVGLTPNAVTVISAAFSLAAVLTIALIRPTIVSGIFVTLGLVIGYALDAADGQLARLRGGGSLAGEWLDHMVDAVKSSALHLAVLVTAARWFDFPSAWLLIPVMYVLVDSVSFFGMTLNDQLRRLVVARNDESLPAQNTSVLRSLLVLPNDYGLLCLIFVLLGWPIAFFVAYTVMFTGAAGYLVLASVKWFNAMRDLDAPVIPPAVPDVHDGHNRAPLNGPQTSRSKVSP